MRFSPIVFPNSFLEVFGDPVIPPKTPSVWKNLGFLGVQ